MTLFRAQHNTDYSVVRNDIIRDKRLSWKAKGIWLYAFSRKDDWTFYLKDIVNHSTDGRDSVRGGLAELEEFGYLTREQTRENGKFADFTYVFHEISLKKCLPETENPTSVNPTSVNRPLLNTDPIPSTESKKRERSAEAPPPLISFGNHVKLKEEDYRKFATDWGKEATDAMIEELNDYIDSKGVKYKCYAATLRKWFRRKKDFDNTLSSKARQKSKQKIAQDIIDSYDLEEPRSAEVYKDCVMFNIAGHASIFLYFTENDFENKLESRLRKMGIKRNKQRGTVYD